MEKIITNIVLPGPENSKFGVSWRDNGKEFLVATDTSDPEHWKFEYISDVDWIQEENKKNGYVYLNEIWAKVIDTDKFLISSLGRVYRTKLSKYKKSIYPGVVDLKFDRDDYSIYCNHYIHVTEEESFYHNSPQESGLSRKIFYVHHIDENKRNNQIWNVMKINNIEHKQLHINEQWNTESIRNKRLEHYENEGYRNKVSSALYMFYDTDKGKIQKMVGGEKRREFSNTPEGKRINQYSSKKAFYTKLQNGYISSWAYLDRRFLTQKDLVIYLRSNGYPEINEDVIRKIGKNEYHSNKYFELVGKIKKVPYQSQEEKTESLLNSTEEEKKEGEK